MERPADPASEGLPAASGPEGLLQGVHWLGHSGIFLQGPVNVCIDPFQLQGDIPGADLVLITHPHYDHCSARDVARLARAGTVIMGPADALAKPDALAKLPDLGLRRIAMAPGQAVEAGGIRIRAVPAFCRNRPHHPKGKGWLGFLVEWGGRRIFHAGDGDAVAEAAGERPDIALLPIDIVYNMNGGDGVAAAQALRPGLAAPIHFGTVCGVRREAERFVAGCAARGIKAGLLERAAWAQAECRVPAPAPELAI
jgi:L-ascorbate metabolism protein UlaG (beta-lactamase superfamily)